MPSSDIIGNFYPTDYYAYQPPQLSSEPSSFIKRAAWKWRMQRFNAYATSLGYLNFKKFNAFAKLSIKFYTPKTKIPPFIDGGTLLDIGCGAGHYLLEMKHLGWKTTGIELSHAACIAARKAGLEIYNGTIEDTNFPDNSFDIIRMSDVLEHVPTPHQLLDHIQRILKPNGLVEITLPNLDSWTFDVFKEYWFPLEIPRHLFHHTPKSMLQLIEVHGFKIKSLNIWSHKEVDIIPSLPWLLCQRFPTLYKIFNHAFIWKLIRKSFFPLKVVANLQGKGSAMTITLIKKSNIIAHAKKQ